MNAKTPKILQLIYVEENMYIIILGKSQKFIYGKKLKIYRYRKKRSWRVGSGLRTRTIFKEDLISISSNCVHLLPSN